MTCPECSSGNIHGETHYSSSQKGHVEIDCYCDNCGCEWIEIEETEITKHGNTKEE
mgnify:CR=1 FL=1